MSRTDPQGVGYDPIVLRTLLDAYGRILREFNAMRRESNDVAELLAIAAAVDEIEAKRDSCQRRLDRVETHRFTSARRQARLLAVTEAESQVLPANAQRLIEASS